MDWRCVSCRLFKGRQCNEKTPFVSGGKGLLWGVDSQMILMGGRGDLGRGV